MSVTLPFSRPLWRWSGDKASWYFITLDEDDSAFIRHIEDKFVGGFGSVRVEVTVGGSVWRTSIFPTREKRYLLPVKAEIRKREWLEEGREVVGSVRIV